MTLHERAAAVRDRLQRAGLRGETASFDAEVLIRHALGWDRARWIAGLRELEPSSLGTTLEPLVARRERREPVAYILGTREFWGLDFEVTPDVLIPRPETEMLVEETLARLPRPGVGPRPVVIDVGTGSGCIALAIAHERPDVRMTATDISPEALAVARRNAARHRADVTFLVADLLAGVTVAPDIIVANPPYVPQGARRALSKEVGEHEPATALFGRDEDGLGTTRTLLAQAAALLHTGGWLLFEFGYGQADPIRHLIAQHASLRLECIREDLQEIERSAVVQRV